MKKVLLYLSLICILSGSKAQSVERYVIGAAGGTYNDGTHYVDYTSGEVTTSTLSNVTYFLTQGFQQPFTNQYVTVEEVQQPEDLVRVYPNPAVDLLNLEFSESGEEHYKIMLMNGLGQLLLCYEANPGKAGILQIDLRDYASGSYFLRIYQGVSLITSEQIIKINQ